MDNPEDIGFVQCHRCGAFHFNSDGPCPDCGAGTVYQCFETTRDNKPIKTHANAAELYRQLARRLQERIDDYLDQARQHEQACT